VSAKSYNPGAPRSSERADAIIAFLQRAGAARMGHGAGRALLDHLIGTYGVVRRWGQPPWLQHAALIHSVYGTDTYDRRLLSYGARDELAAIAGADAERLAFLFSVTPRRPLFAGTHLWARDLPLRASGNGDSPPSRAELDALVLLHMANLAEQARSADGSPGRWLVSVRDLGEHVVDSEAIVPPAFTALLAAFSPEQESLTRGAYVGALDGPSEARPDALALAAATCPVIPEPCAWLAHLSLRRGEDGAAQAWAGQARRRLTALGTPWDKRLAFDEWLALIEALERPPAGGLRRADEEIADPRALLEAVLGGAADGSPAAARPSIVAPDPSAGRKRFQRYVESLADPDGPVSGAMYPDLPRQAWHDPHDFPIVGYLEANHRAIAAEISALAATRFHRESERIERTGDWDVAFLYERGRRREEVCSACPVTAYGIETYPAIRTIAGLIYVSRMRPGTHISPHRGPTNLRVRCHLGVNVPDGDCGIRVGEQTRPWQGGRCLVFDDSLEHEAWNHTDDDRIVLIVDLWHPGLSATEVTLLEALHNYTYFHARRLNRYWSANAAAARQNKSPSPPKSPPSPSPQPPSPPSPSPQPPSPSPSPSPNSPPTASAPRPSPAPSADPISSVDSSPPPPNPLK
jgi:aspartate beta-hydroxylase